MVSVQNGRTIPEAVGCGCLLHNLRYCCLLANPQNLDISTLLDVPPEQSPFAYAMQRASHVLIIPNSSVTLRSIGLVTTLPGSIFEMLPDASGEGFW